MGNQQPSPADQVGKVQRLSRKGVVPRGTKRLAPRTGDDIVHPFWKLKERCKALVASSSLAPGAERQNRPTSGDFVLLRREGSAGRFRARLEDLASIFLEEKSARCTETVSFEKCIHGLAPGASKLDTNSFFEDESVRSPSSATIFLGQRRRGDGLARAEERGLGEESARASAFFFKKFGGYKIIE